MEKRLRIANTIIFNCRRNARGGGICTFSVCFFGDRRGENRDFEKTVRSATIFVPQLFGGAVTVYIIHTRRYERPGQFSGRIPVTRCRGPFFVQVRRRDRRARPLADPRFRWRENVDDFGGENSGRTSRHGARRRQNLAE